MQNAQIHDIYTQRQNCCQNYSYVTSKFPAKSPPTDMKFRQPPFPHFQCCLIKSLLVCEMIPHTTLKTGERGGGDKWGTIHVYI